MKSTNIDVNIWGIHAGAHPSNFYFTHRNIGAREKHANVAVDMR